MTDEGPVNQGRKVRYGLPQHKIYPNNYPVTARAKTDGGRKRVRDGFRLWLSMSPQWVRRDSVQARNIWFDEMAEQDRADCIAMTPAYLLTVAKPPAPHIYLKRRLWRTVHTAKRIAPVERKYAAYAGKLWMASFLWVLTGPPTGRMHITGFEQKWIESGGISEDELMCSKRAAAGWPEAVEMLSAAPHGLYLDAVMLPVADGWRGAEWGGEIVEAWGRMHARRCWPWLTVAPPEGFVWLPVLPDGGEIDDRVDAAFAAFAKKANEIMNGVPSGQEN